MNNKKKTLIISSIIILLLLAVGATYAFFTYESGTKSDIVTGQIYMNYEETSTISLTGVFPETKAQALARNDENGVFEFTITGRNTSDKPVYYEIDLLEGGVITGKDASSTRILPEHVMIYLERDGEVLIDGMTYQDFDTRRIWVETVPANQASNIEHKYTLRMWIDESVTISDTNPYADYTSGEWNSAYASLKVRVTGDFNVKTSPYDYMARFGSINYDTGEMAFWPENIEAEKANITSINFVNMNQTTMDERYDDATIKADVTDTTKSEAGSVLSWLEPDTTDTTKYTMYVASDGTTYFPEDSSAMFAMFQSLTNIQFENVSTKDVTNMMMMFAYCSNLPYLDFDKFNTSMVNNMMYMFLMCSNLNSLDLSNFETSNLTNMSYMFVACSGLANLDLSEWDTSNVTDMTSVFYECIGLTNLNLSGWDIKNVISTNSMFAGCSSLKTIYDNADWNTGNVEDNWFMFDGCTSLVGAVTYDSTKTDITMANPDTGYFTRKEA